MGGDVHAMQRERKPLGQKKIESGQAEAVAAFARDHPVQEEIVRICRYAVVDIPLFDEQEAIESGDHPAGVAPVLEGGTDPLGDPGDFLPHSVAVDGNAGQFRPQKGGKFDEGFSHRQFPVRQACDGGKAGKPVGHLREISSTGCNIDRNFQEEEKKKQDKEKGARKPIFFPHVSQCLPEMPRFPAGECGKMP